ncbi:MAG: efflux RND transporter periplasmic adaptor subunit, partial [Nitrospinales bacterium]
EEKNEKQRLSQNLKLKEAQLKNDIAVTEAKVEKAQANLLEGETQLSYATLTAPIDGIIASVSTQEGETVAASLNAPTFVTLIDLRQLQVTVYVDETDIGQVKVKQEGVFTVDSYPNRFFKGVVREIYPKAVIKDNVVNYEVILEIEKKGLELLRPEMTANVVITTDTRKNVITIPKEALKRIGKKKFVVLKADGIVVSREVETGWREAGWQEIVSGVDEGDEVGIPIKPQASERKGRRPRRR